MDRLCRVLQRAIPWLLASLSASVQERFSGPSTEYKARDWDRIACRLMCVLGLLSLSPKAIDFESVDPNYCFWNLTHYVEGEFRWLAIRFNLLKPNMGALHLVWRVLLVNYHYCGSNDATT